MRDVLIERQKYRLNETRESYAVLLVQMPDPHPAGGHEGAGERPDGEDPRKAGEDLEDARSVRHVPPPVVGAPDVEAVLPHRREVLVVPPQHVSAGIHEEEGVTVVPVGIATVASRSTAMAG